MKCLLAAGASPGRSEQLGGAHLTGRLRRFGHGVGSEPRAGARERCWRVRWGKDKVRDLKLWHMENGADLSE